jgi:hypothetical protein
MIANQSGVYGGDFSLLAPAVDRGLDFILEHFEFQFFIWPRTISTKTTQGRQILVYNKEEAFARFKQANFLDCRISAYPSSKYLRSIKQEPSFLFIDLDSQTPGLDRELQHTLINVKLRFENSDIEPAVLWSGRGYHIYLPVIAPLLENESLFEDIEVYDPSRKFLQWAEQYLSNNKADPCHSLGVSFNNCMLRIPGSVNSKVGKQVTVVQEWNKIKHSINPLLYEFYIHLATTKIREVQGIKIKRAPSTRKFYSYWRTSAKNEI